QIGCLLEGSTRAGKVGEECLAAGQVDLAMNIAQVGIVLPPADGECGDQHGRPKTRRAELWVGAEQLAPGRAEPVAQIVEAEAKTGQFQRLGVGDRAELNLAAARQGIPWLTRKIRDRAEGGETKREETRGPPEEQRGAGRGHTLAATERV